MSVKRIAVTGAGGQIAYSLIFRIASGEMLGPDVPVALHLLEIPEAVGSLKGLAMELEDCAFPLLREVRYGSDPFEVFKDVNLALLVGAKPRTLGMERKDLLADNGKIFIAQGKALNEVAAPDLLVVVVGNPCNTNCLIAMHNAPRIPKNRFFAMTRLDQNRAEALLARKAQARVDEVSHVVVWGNHSSTQVPDYLNAKIRGKSAVEVVGDRSWLEGAFITEVQQRGSTVIAARGKSSAASAANAVLDTVRSLIFPTPEGEWFSVSIDSAHNPYGIKEGLIFSFPCRSKGEGRVEIVKGLKSDSFLQNKILLSEKELLEEREFVVDLL